MRKFIDLIDKRFGRLVVISLSEKNKWGGYRWLCQCDCGNQKEINSRALVTNNTRSCGCLLKESTSKREFINLLDQKFGKLTVISQAEGRYNRQILWNCLCECGNETIVTSGNLRRGSTKSCGCYQKDVQRSLHTTHGLSGTAAYREYVEKGRKLLDIEWTKEMDKSLKTFQPVCVICGSDYRMSTDHVYPFSKGYGLRPGNAVRLCTSCNVRKHDKTPEELPRESRYRILLAAKKFENYWNNK
jgi:5-methylcytosine-specific restriction endonuclease McrA